MKEFHNISAYYQELMIALRDIDKDRIARALDRLELAVVRARKKAGMYGPIDRFEA